MSDSNSTSTNSATVEQSPTKSISRSPEEHRKYADEWAKVALANLNKVGEQKAAEKAARSSSQAPEMSPGADQEPAAKQELPANALPLV